MLLRAQEMISIDDLLVPLLGGKVWGVGTWLVSRRERL